MQNLFNLLVVNLISFDCNKYIKKVLPYSIAWFALFYVVAILTSKNLDGTVAQVGRGLFVTYANLGMMMMYISGLTVLYYGSRSWRKSLEKLAPVGRMSVTNYMAQSLLGVIIFYGFGLGLAVKCSFLECALVGLAVCAFQIWYSNLWMKKFYYGPMEWLWRSLTWFQRVPMRR